MTDTAFEESDGVVLPLQPAPAQRKASDPAASVWVGASAGSGKTKVLADRVIRLLLADVPPQRLLCLTFTRAAAAEMSIRITRQLARWATCSDDELRDDLADLQGMQAFEDKQLDAARRLFARVLGCPGGMRIHTIHAFGQEILRRFPVESGLPPHFAVLDEADARAIWHDAQSDVLRTASSAPASPEGKALRSLAGGLGEEKFGDLLKEAAKDAQRLEAAINRAGGLKKLAALVRGLLELEPKETEASIRKSAVHEDGFPREKVLWAAQTLCKQGSKRYKERGQIMLDWLALPKDETAAALHSYARAFLKADGEPFKDIANKELLHAQPLLEPVIARETARILSVLERLDTLRMAEETEAVVTLAVALNRRYAARKTAQAVLDYNDLIRHTDGLLHRPGIAPWVLFKLDGGVDHILVDEAQDTSPAQWRIIKALADEFFTGLGAHADQNRTLFVVGDEKQSIFSFQGADPDAFEHMRKYFRKRILDAERLYEEVPLNVSFRSAPAVLKAVDAVFADEAVRRGVSRKVVHHEASHREATGRVEVWPLVPAPKKDNAEWALPLDYETFRNPPAELAGLIAERIRDWHREGIMIYDRKAKSHRPLAYSDVMILVRKRGAFVEHLVRALKTLDVPVTGTDRMVLTEQLSVMDLVALLQFTLLPEDDLTLATVLRGPLLGCSEDQLMQLAIGRKGSLWQSLTEKAQTDAAFAPAHAYLKERLAMADEITAFAMLVRVLSEPCPADGVSGRRAIWKRLGPDALDPIDELLNAAQQFGARHTPSLQAFLHWLMATEAEIKREMDPGAGQVRIATVHAAKGLEAPVVILPDTVSTPRKNDVPKILWHPEHGVPFYVPREPQNAGLRALRVTARQKQLEEYRRLLYVAMTRAADRLYVCGWEMERPENFDGSWYALASGALKPLHEPATVDKKSPIIPAIAFADPVFPHQHKRSGRIEEQKRKPEITLPEWISRPPAPDPKPPRPLTPSRPEEDEPPFITPQDARFARGRIIHRLLQSLPDLDATQQETAAARFLKNPQHNLTPEQQKEVAREVFALLRHPDFAPLFGPGSRAEVPITGLIGDRIIAGQVDRLCVREKEVWIVDYKTNRPPPSSVNDVPSVYLKQLEAYRAVLRIVYPAKSVRVFLLWTYEPRLMLLPDGIFHVP
jgi:ATP-dependent helicase/nuclease subunit A